MANIGPKGIRHRAFGSFPLLLITIGIGAYMVLQDWDHGLRLLIVIPLWLVLLGFLQAKEKT